MLAYEVVEPRAGAAAEPTLLCLHGNSSHRGIWRPVARELDEFRCLLLDLRGHGESDHVVPPAYNPEDHAVDLARVIGALGLGPYAILAHSAGALAATRFIASARAEVALPVAFVWVDLDPLVPRWQVEYFHQRAGSVARVFDTVEDAVAAFRRAYPGIPDACLHAFVAEGLRPVGGGWRMKLDPGTYVQWEPGDLRPMLGKVAVPTLVLRGGASAVSSADGLTALGQGIAGCEVREIDGGSHMVLLEYPREVATEIRAFLRRSRPART